MKKAFMKIALINGSPKGSKSSSGILLEDLSGCLSGKSEIEIMEIGLHTAVVSKSALEKLDGAGVWVISSPLYVDGIPGHLLSCLVQIENSSLCNGKISVYGMINCGFYEGKQAEIALDILKNWCKKAGIDWCGGIGAGGGGALPAISGIKPGHGPKAAIDKSIADLAEHICRMEKQENNYVTVGMPRAAYQMAAQMGWRQAIRKNGGKTKDLGKRW